VLEELANSSVSRNVGSIESWGWPLALTNPCLGDGRPVVGLMASSGLRLAGARSRPFPLHPRWGKLIIPLICDLAVVFQAISGFTPVG